MPLFTHTSLLCRNAMQPYHPSKQPWINCVFKGFSSWIRWFKCVIPNPTNSCINILPTRRTLGKEPLVDYSNSHVMMFNQYLVVLKQKTMDKEVTDKVRVLKIKEGEEKKSRRFQDTLTPTKQSAQRIIEKEQRTKFIQAWSTTTIKATSECFQNNFRAGFWAHPLGYRRFSLGSTYAQQRFAKQQRMARMWLTKHVPAKLQLSSQQE